jgi:hypothetical protein
MVSSQKINIRGPKSELEEPTMLRVHSPVPAVPVVVAIAAFGDSDGDLKMLEWPVVGEGLQ